MKTPIYDLFEAETMLMRKDCAEGLTPEEDLQLNNVQEDIRKCLSDEEEALQFFQDQEETELNRIKEIRKLSGLTQIAFSEKYEIPFRTLQSWELGKREPAPYILNLLEKVVKYDLESEKIGAV